MSRWLSSKKTLDTLDYKHWYYEIAKAAAPAKFMSRWQKKIFHRECAR